jgi:O-antigen/teichoic acid export membrane protein
MTRLLPAATNLRLNSLAVVLSSAVTSLLGLAFWGVAAKLFPAAEVGVAAAMILSAVMLSTLSNLSLGALYERFLPVAGRRAGSLLVRGYLAVAGMACVLAIGLILLGPRHTLFRSGWEVAIYPAFVVVLALFALQDNTVAGLGVARWGAAKNAFHGAAKLAAIIALAATGAALAIVVSWGLTAAVALCWVMVAIRKRVRNDARYSGPPALPPRRELLQYFGASYGITALASIAPLVVPLVVIARVGPEASAYFAVCWSIVSAVAIVLNLLISPFVAECAAHPDKIGNLSANFVKMVVAVAVLGGLGLAYVAPVALGFIGSQYRQQGTPLLHLAALFIPLTVVSAVYGGLARVYRRLTLAVATECVVTAVIIGGTAATTGSMGVLGVGLSYLVAEAVATMILLGPLIRWLRELGNGSQPTETRRGVVLVGNSEPVGKYGHPDSPGLGAP